MKSGSFPLYAVIIPSAIAGVFGLILLILIIRKCCCKKNNSSHDVIDKQPKNVVILNNHTTPHPNNSAQNIHQYHDIDPQIRNLGITPK